ncbi:MAG: ABC transporter permease [Phycisphaerae bacterium]
MAVPIKYNLRNLLERWPTTAMTAIGVGLTVAVLVTAIALTTGLASVFASTGNPLQLLILRTGTDAELTSQITTESADIIRQLPGIARNDKGEPLASPEGLTIVNLPSVDNPEGMNVIVRGLLPVGIQMRNPTLLGGNMISPGKREVVVGQSIAKRYPSAQIGQQLRFGKGLWTVVGVFSVGQSAANSEVWVDLNQLRGDFDSAGGSSSLLLRADSPTSMTALTQRIDNDQRLNCQALRETDYYANLTKSGAPLMVLGFSVAVIMAVGSAFAATNTMYAAVARRAREVGTLRALGFSRASILASFMLESICLALLGGLLGCLIALPVNNFTTGVGNFATFSETTFQFKVTPLALAAGLAFAALIGTLGGFLPAYAASKKSIVQAMRDA